ncbi:putative transmembrane protein [Toxoplasma gondii RUB]|uniref:Putative transmembrane protein n=1 Tax=Toxoplasma gondii RUB TaxID=935652 RepID=A0A086LLY2_TOXGO|nr:putative transmembrane protein [Toxoplasma gondii RUB]
MEATQGCGVVAQAATPRRHQKSFPLRCLVLALTLFPILAPLICSEWITSSVHLISNFLARPPVHFASAISAGRDPEETGDAAASPASEDRLKRFLNRFPLSASTKQTSPESAPAPPSRTPSPCHERGNGSPQSACSQEARETKFLAGLWIDSDSPLRRQMCESLNADAKLAKQFVLLALLMVRFSDDADAHKGRVFDPQASVQLAYITELLHRLLVDAHAEPSRRSGFLWQNAEPCQINAIAGKEITLVAVRLFKAIQKTRVLHAEAEDLSTHAPDSGNKDASLPAFLQYWTKRYTPAKKKANEEKKKTGKVEEGEWRGSAKSFKNEGLWPTLRATTPRAERGRDGEARWSGDSSAEKFRVGEDDFAYHHFLVRLMEEEPLDSAMWVTQDILKFAQKTRMQLRPGETLPELINHATSLWSSYLVARRLQAGDTLETTLEDWRVGPAMVPTTTGAFQDAGLAVSDALREPIMDEPVCGHIFLLLDGFRSSPLATLFTEGSTTAAQLERFRQYLLSVLMGEIEKAVDQLAEDLRLVRGASGRRSAKGGKKAAIEGAPEGAAAGNKGEAEAFFRTPEARLRVTRKQLPITRLAGYVVKLGSGVFVSGVVGEGNSYEANQRLLQAMTSDSMLVEIQFFNEGTRSLKNVANPLVSLPEQPLVPSERGSHTETRNLRNGVEDERDEAANILRDTDALLSEPDWTTGDPEAVIPVGTVMKALKRHINAARGALPIWLFRRSFVIYSTIEPGDVVDPLADSTPAPFASDHDIHFFVYVPISNYSANVGEKLRKSFLLMAQSAALGATHGLSGVGPAVDDSRIKELGTAKLTDDGQALKLKTFGIGLDDNQRTNVQKFIQKDMVLIHYKIKGLATLRSSLAPGEEWRLVRAEKIFGRILKHCRNLLEVPYAVVVKKQPQVETRQTKKVPEVEGGLPTWVLAVAVVCTALPLLIFMCCLQFHKRLPFPWWVTCICSSRPPWEAAREDQDVQSVSRSRCATQNDLCGLYDLPSISDRDSGTDVGAGGLQQTSGAGTSRQPKWSPKDSVGSRLTSRSGVNSPPVHAGPSAWSYGGSPLGGGSASSRNLCMSVTRGGWHDATARWIGPQQGERCSCTPRASGPRQRSTPRDGDARDTETSDRMRRRQSRDELRCAESRGDTKYAGTGRSKDSDSRDQRSYADGRDGRSSEADKTTERGRAGDDSAHAETVKRTFRVSHDRDNVDQTRPIAKGAGQETLAHAGELAGAKAPDSGTGSRASSSDLTSPVRGVSREHMQGV